MNIPRISGAPTGTSMGERPNLYIDSFELTELHREYMDVCNELGIPGQGEMRRDEVATVVMDLAHAGESDAQSIHQRTLSKLANR